MFPAALRAIARKTQRLLSQCRANDTKVLQDHCVILLKHRLEGKTFCEVKNLNKLLLILRQRKYTGSGPCCRLRTLLPAPDLVACSGPCCGLRTLLPAPYLSAGSRPCCRLRTLLLVLDLVIGSRIRFIFSTPNFPGYPVYFFFSFSSPKWNWIRNTVHLQ